MKNKIASLFITIAALFIAGKVKAQCPADVDNQLGCSVRVEITYYTSCGSPMTPRSTTPFVTVLPPFSGPTPVSCAACMGVTPCDMQVTITHVGGTPVTNVSANLSTASPGNSTSIPASCGSTASIYYNGPDFVIN